MDKFFFYKVGGRRNRTEILHDLLVVAKDGLKKIKITSEANLTCYLMINLLKFAEAAGLIEEVEVLQYERYERKKPVIARARSSAATRASCLSSGRAVAPPITAASPEKDRAREIFVYVIVKLL